MLARAAFEELQSLWGLRYSFDRFSSAATTQGDPALPFHSKWGCPEATGWPDAFAHEWSGEVNWLHPPRADIGQAILHLKTCSAEGTIIVPLRPSAVWWPLVRAGSKSVAWFHGRPARHVFPRRRGLLRGDGGTRELRPRFHLLAVHLDFRRGANRRKVVESLRASLSRRIGVAS